MMISVTCGMKRKREGEEPTTYTAQRQSILNISMVKLQSPCSKREPSLRRSVLIFNTLKQIETELKHEGVKPNPAAAKPSLLPSIETDDLNFDPLPAAGNCHCQCPTVLTDISLCHPSAPSSADIVVRDCAHCSGLTAQAQPIRAPLQDMSQLGNALSDCQNDPQSSLTTSANLTNHKLLLPIPESICTTSNTSPSPVSSCESISSLPSSLIASSISCVFTSSSANSIDSWFSDTKSLLDTLLSSDMKCPSVAMELDTTTTTSNASSLSNPVVPSSLPNCITSFCNNNNSSCVNVSKVKSNMAISTSSSPSYVCTRDQDNVLTDLDLSSLDFDFYVPPISPSVKLPSLSAEELLSTLPSCGDIFTSYNTPSCGDLFTSYNATATSCNPKSMKSDVWMDDLDHIMQVLVGS